MQGVTLMLMMRNDLLLLSDEEVLSSLEAHKKSMRKKIKVKDENLYITIAARSDKLHLDWF
mgnify:FL=1|tara:strand:+ start:583 stop:765 length:183 start_codon:yes stop_codon:yes gene_type:complete